jgi:hypothetical protein
LDSVVFPLPDVPWTTTRVNRPSVVPRSSDTAAAYKSDVAPASTLASNERRERGVDRLVTRETPCLLESSGYNPDWV